MVTSVHHFLVSSQYIDMKTDKMIMLGRHSKDSFNRISQTTICIQLPLFHYDGIGFGFVDNILIHKIINNNNNNN